MSEENQASPESELDKLRTEVAEELGDGENGGTAKPVRRPETQRLVVRRVNPEVPFSEDQYTVDQAMNFFPDQNTYTYAELQKLYADGIQISIRG